MTTADRSPRAALVPWTEAAAEPFTAAQLDAAALALQARSPGTRRAYASQLDAWAAWTRDEGVAPLPASPETLARFLLWRAAFCRRCDDQHPGGCPDPRCDPLPARPLAVASLRVASSAVSFLHRALGLADPAASQAVRDTLRLLARELARPQRQAEGLDHVAETAILGALHREERAGRIPAARAARDRALLLVMRDALLRRSEAAALTWADVEPSPAEGAGLVHVRRSKTDQEGAGAILPLCPETWAALQAMRPPEPPPEALIFGIGERQIARRLRALGELAGLPRPFSGHSPRVGMAQDMAKEGEGLPAMMQAGRWKRSEMPARYTARLDASEGATARVRQKLRPRVHGSENGEGDEGEGDGGEA